MRPDRRGLTLVEVLVTIAIIAIMVALLIPAVQFARESSRRSACRNNLKQIGIGIAAIVTETGHFPEYGFRGGYSFHVQLLKHLDQFPIYDAINFSHVSVDSAFGNMTVANASVAVFLCPSDRKPPGGWTNYAGNNGVGVQKYGYNGAFVRSQSPPSGLSEFLDGTSQTAAVSEWVLGPDNDLIRDPIRTVFETPISLTNPDQFDEFVALCHDIDPVSALPSVRIKGRNWLIREFSDTLYNHTLNVNGHSCLNKTGVQVGAYTAGSLHAGGVQVLFADGHVAFVRDGVDLSIWRAIGSRNGREILSADSF